MSTSIVNQEKQKASESVDNNFRNHRVLKVAWYTEDLFELKIARDEMSFTPGDCVSIFHPEANISRPYSIASGINDPHLSFLIRCMPDGVMTRWLSALKPGDELPISEPYGWFRPGETAERGEPFVFVATGTGIAPFLAYLRSNPEKSPLAVYYGVKRKSEAIGDSEIAAICPLHLAVSRENRADVFRGRVTDLLKDHPLSGTAHYYLCGLDSMIEEVTQILETKGVNSINIHTEVFFHAASE